MTTHEITLKLHKCERYVAPRVTIRRGDNNTQTLIATIEDASAYEAGTTCRFKVLHHDCTWAQSSAEWDGTKATTLLTSDVLNGKGACRLAYFEFVKPTEVEGGEDSVETTSNLELYLMQDIDVTDKQARGYSQELERLYKELSQLETQVEAARNNCIVATKDTQKATEDANTATEYANAATSKANIAGDKADEAATAASEAAAKIDTAVTNAKEATSNANTAADKANGAVIDAQQAITDVQATDTAVKANEEGRKTAESDRKVAEAKRVVEFAEMMEKVTSVKIHLCEGGEYDETTRKPTLVGDPNYIYLTPATNEGTNDHYYEWVYINQTFEKIGSTDASYEGISVATIDEILNGASKTGSEVATTTGVSYLVGKLNTNFAKKDHDHVKADITDFDHTHVKADITDFKHTHVKADITDLVLGEGTLTIKQGDTVKGTFGANSTSNETVEIEEYEHPEKAGWYHVPAGGATTQHLEWDSDGKAKWVDRSTTVTSGDTQLITSDAVYNAIGRGTLTIKQGDTTKGTFSANADLDNTIKLDEYEHPIKSGWKHIPAGGAANNLLTYSADGTAQWTAPASAVEKDNNTPITSGGVYTKLQEYAPLDSPALINTPTAPTAAAGTSTTQIATCAFVADAINTAITEVENGTY